MHTSRGFTLLEVLLSIAVLGIIAGVATPIYQSFQVRNDLGIATESIVNGLRRAQILSESMEGDTSSGVYLQSGSSTVFRGTSYVTRDTTWDEVTTIPTSMTLSGINQIVFSKFTGLPQTTGIITITSSINEVRTITINEKGMLTY